MKAGLDEGPAGGHRARDLLAVQLPVSSERDERRIRIALIALLDRCLGLPKLGPVHRQNLPHRPTGSATVLHPTLPQVITCPTCQQENPDGARFCNSCGASLGREDTSAREERRIVTVLFADMAGFTARAERLDPEDVRAILAQYYAKLRGEIEGFGGIVEKFIGDAVVAFFGAPVAHGDDPERAVRAAFAVSGAVAAMNNADPDLNQKLLNEGM